MKTNTINTNSKANAVRVTRIERKNRVKTARKNFIFCLSAILMMIQPLIIDGAKFVNLSLGNKLMDLGAFGLIATMFFTSSVGVLKSNKRK